LFADIERSRQLARMLVDTCTALGVPAAAVLSDMSQPLGEWAGHACEVMESLQCLEGGGDPRLVALTLALCEVACALAGHGVGRERLERALHDGSAREAFLRWARAQGAESAWTEKPRLELAPVESVVVAARGGVLGAVRTRDLGMLVQETSRDRSGRVDAGVSLRSSARLGDRVAQGQELARLYLRAEDPLLVERCRACFVVGDTGEAPPLIAERVAPAAR
ncbi:MAG TPA: hypothetical protein VNB06_01755, partial [Thermoanaerobaculia bacterium]|nr:hypothetical protein [Thermoanaerobaculia bacterium]